MAQRRADIWGQSRITSIERVMASLYRTRCSALPAPGPRFPVPEQ